jgi:hypothetical protein
MTDDILVPTAVDIETVLAGLKAGDTDFAKWLRLAKIDDAESNKEEFRIGDTLWWAEAIDPSGLCGEYVGGGHTPAEAAAGAWVVACLGEYPPCVERVSGCETVIGPDYPAGIITNEEYLSVPRRVADGWQFELFDMPASGEIQ